MSSDDVGHVPHGVVGVFEPTDEQREGVGHVIGRLYDRPGFILAYDTGLGKTLMALMVAHHFAGADGRVLIVSPAAVVSSWVAHAAQSHPSRDVRSIGGRGGRGGGDIDAFMTGTHWLVVSYEYFTLHYAAFRRHGRNQIALAVFDEAHLLGQLDTQRRKCARTLPTERRLLLTATPCSDDPMQLYSLLDLAVPGCAADAETWRRMVVEPLARAHESSYTRRLLPWSRGLIDQLVLRRQRPVGQLLSRYDYIVQCAVSDVQRNLAAVVVRASSGALCARAMREIATHPLLLGVRSKPSAAGACVQEHLRESWTDTPDYISAAPKLAAFVLIVVTILRETSDKVVVFADELNPLRCYVDALSSTCEKLGLTAWKGCELFGGLNSAERDARVVAFNDAESSERVAWVSTKAAGAGLTLTGANRAIILYPSHNPMWDYQAFGRLHRPPQHKECFHYVLVSEGCADERVLLRQLVKSSVERCIFDPNASPIDFDRDATLCQPPRSAEDAAADPGGTLQVVLRSEPVAAIADPLLSEVLLTCPFVTAVFTAPDRSAPVQRTDDAAAPDVLPALPLAAMQIAEV